MPTKESKDVRGCGNASAREIHEITYWKHYTGASESQVRAAIARAGCNCDRIARELKRLVNGES